MGIGGFCTIEGNVNAVYKKNAEKMKLWAQNQYQLQSLLFGAIFLVIIIIVFYILCNQHSTIYIS